LRVEIQGHSDERGTNNYNIALGERRANSTKKYLVAQGVDSNRVNIISYGEEKPFCTISSNENCWFLNRRAHFRVAR
jgi:peptidoglycan-associated lipoprotein